MPGPIPKEFLVHLYKDIKKHKHEFTRFMPRQSFVR